MSVLKLDRRRWLMAAGQAVAVSALPACGFRLRQPPEFSFTSLYLNAPASAFRAELQRQLASTGKVLVLQESAQLASAQVVLDLLSDIREKVVVGRNAAGQVREFQLRQRFKYRLRTPQGKELIAETELLAVRDISFNETQVLAKEAEDQLLYRDMQSDLVQQLLRRLAAVREI